MPTTSNSDGRPAPTLESEWLVDTKGSPTATTQGRVLPAVALDRWAAAVQPYVPSAPVRVIDVSAGTGIFAAAWSRWGAASVVAIEPPQP
jgi:predicted RNA methylase